MYWNEVSNNFCVTLQNIPANEDGDDTNDSDYDDDGEDDNDVDEDYYNTDGEDIPVRVVQL